MSTEIQVPRTTSKKEFWQKHIEECKRSGLSQNKYCNAHSLALSTFGYWKKRLRDTNEARPRFFPLTLHTPSKKKASRSGSGVCLYLGKGKYRVGLREDFSADCLKQLLAVLQEL